jgi:hypothetical protein
VGKEKWFNSKDFLGKKSGILLLPHLTCELEMLVKNWKSITKVEMHSTYTSVKIFED